MTVLRIIGSQLILYDGQELHFYTVEGACTQSVNVGQHVRHIEPMKDQVIVTYTDQGVYDDPIGKEIVNVVSTDGTKTSQRAFAEQHMLQYDIPMTKGKPYACLSTVHYEILHFNEQFHSKVDVINALKEQYDLAVGIVVVIEIENGEKPALTISPAMSQFASSIGAEIDIDLYAYAYSEVSYD